MKKELLVIYARNHSGSLTNHFIAVTIFMAAKYKLYGIPHGLLDWGQDIGLLSVSLLMLLRLRDVYRKRIIAPRATLQESNVPVLVGEIRFNKILYMLPWLYFLFSPIHSEFLYDHLLGYAFVFVITAVYASSSAPMLSLLLFDIGLPSAVALGITVMNDNVQETRYFGAAVLMFAIFAFNIGNKIRISTLQLVDSRQKAAQSARRADEANRAKSSFLALMSHEIRTPMTGIFGMIDFLKETELSDQQKDFVVTIRECSKTLLNTLNDILDISKIESGKLAISRINYDFGGTLQSSGRVLQQLAEDKGLTLKTDISANMPPMVYGDPHRTQQVILNLLNNAVKFTEKGSVTLKAVFVDGAEPKLHVEVNDTGIGLSREAIAKLFSAFSQADATIARKYGGSGLGLSITKSLVELMGGRIGVNSDEGKGSSFWFDLPYAAPVDGANDVFEIERDTAEIEIPPMKILVVEDNLINQDIVVKLLQRKKHKITLANNGEEALALVKAEAFDMILMDVNMPRKNGLDTTREIRAMGKKYRKIPIIGLTANIMEDFVKKYHDAGMVGYIAKPFAPKKLYATIARHAQGAVVPAGEDGTHSAMTAPVVKPVKEALAAIAAEMDAGYLKETVASTSGELRRLLSIIEKKVAKAEVPGLGDAAHDMKSVGGMIGLQKTSFTAYLIEDACNRNLLAGLEDLSAELGTSLAAELKDVENELRNY
ncbi:MAG: ATP-binding protein [Micavibrio sp.]|nr:ATP-binding protein [Micavibrio sp.]